MPAKKTPKKSKKTVKKVKRTPKLVAPKAGPALPNQRGRAGEVGEYTAKQITVLEGLEPVRQRPGMYIGSTGVSGLHHLVWEVIDNSIDEAMGGFCNEIKARLLPDHQVEVTDNGRGIPVDIHKQYKVSALELVLTKLHAGAKFGAGGYKVSGGLHGVGVSVVNALSDWMKAEVRRDGGVFVQEYHLGKPMKKVRQIGKSKEHGTTITFHPDPKVFETLEFDWQTILDHLRQQAYLTKGVRILVSDEREAGRFQSYIFYFEGGIASYVRHLNRLQAPKHENVFYAEKMLADDINVEIAVRYVEDFKELIFAFANNIYNPEGGMHLMGFRAALTRTLNGYARDKGYLKEKDENLTGEDVREGLTAVISVKLKNPQFEGQTKAKLGNPEVKTAVETVFGDSFTAWLEEHPRDAEAIIGKCVLAAKARAAAKIAREAVLRKGALEGFTLPGKLADCSSREAEKSELFIVEGDSAGGCWVGNTKISLTDGRDISFTELIEESKQGKQNFCYTMQDNGHIGIAPIMNPRMTKKNTQIIKIILDNGDELKCTPDHLFRLVDGTYIQAQKLTSIHSLSPLYREISKKQGNRSLDGYEMIFDSKTKKWIYTHVLADMFNLKNRIYTANEGKHRHHADFNKRNNNPTNIQRMSYEHHMATHYERLQYTIHRPDAKLKSIETKQTLEFRQKARQKSLGKRELFSQNAKKQWENEEYKNYMVRKFLEFYNSNEEYRRKNNNLLNRNQKEYWSDAANRGKQAKRVTEYFAAHPEKKEWLRELAAKEWSDIGLKQWRAGKTKEQWTAEFRTKRKKAYNQTYLRKALGVLHNIYDENGGLTIAEYNQIRKNKNDKSLIKYETICQRFFDGNEEKFKEAIKYYNHKIKKIEKMKKRVDVYDLEVPGTHNFALASGVFVHNSAKQGRDREFQAILPLRGKILNVERSRLDKILANNELKSLIIALGTNIGEMFDLTKLRYNRIIIMSDADVDGAHIRTLLLTFFYRYFPDLINQGHIYIAQPPLYRLQIGKEARYVYNEEEKEKVLKEMIKSKEQRVKNKEQKIEVSEKIEAGEEGEAMPEGAMIGGVKVNIQRYKGLGEMNPEQLWDTTMNPQNRILKLVTVEDAEKADEIFDVLMGDEVEPRKRFIQTHAKSVKNLDI